MNSERRNDIGFKITYVVLTAIISFILWNYFNKGYELATKATVDVAVLKRSYVEIERRLQSIDHNIEKLVNGKH